MLARRLLPRLAGARGRLAALPPLQPAGTKSLPFGGGLGPAVCARSAHGKTAKTAGWKLGKKPPAPPPEPVQREPDKTTF